jgi:hypothetical protein
LIIEFFEIEKPLNFISNLIIIKFPSKIISKTCQIFLKLIEHSDHFVLEKDLTYNFVIFFK